MWNYMPILKWKQGEQLALRNLSPTQREKTLPLIELQPIDAAPDAKSLTKALPDYAAKVAGQISKSIPDQYSLCIDTSYLSPGYQRQINLLMNVIEFLQKHIKNEIFPVIHAKDIESIRLLSSVQRKPFENIKKIVLRIRTDLVEASQVAASIAAISGAGVDPSRIHLLVDQYSLVGRTVPDCLMQGKLHLDEALGSGCASLIISGGSFPVNLVGIPQGITNLPRIEWQVWKNLVSDTKYKDVIFSDYAVTNPAPIPEIDPTQMNASIAIRYAGEDFWRIYKGRGFKSKVPGEYRNLCRLLVSDDIYSGAGFSYGDAQYYQKASTGNEKNGTPASWRKEATSHHIVLVASCLQP